MHLRLSPLAMVVAATLSSQAIAADDKSVFSLGEIVVAESTGVRDIAINNVLTQETIEMVGAKTAADALEYVPGIHVAQSNKGEKFLTMQGFEQDKILILLDGVPYYETNYGQLDLNQIPANMIAKVEVTKGASSVLYGPNGMGGVINIITKKGSEGFSGEVRASLGDYGQNHQDASFSYGKGNFSLFGSVEHTGRDAFALSDDYQPTESYIKDKVGDLPKFMQVEDGGSRINSDLEALSARLRAGYTTDTTELYASVFRYETERGLPFHDTENKVFDNYSSFSDVSEYLDQGIDINASHQLSNDLTLRAMTYYHTHTDTLSYYSTPDQTIKLGDSSYDDYTVGGAVFADYNINEVHTLSVSANYKKDVHKKTVVSDPINNPNYDGEHYRNQLNTISVAAEDTMHFGALTVVAGVAWHKQTIDNLEAFEGVADDVKATDTVDPMLGMSYALTDSARVYGSVAQKTRFATFNDMKSGGKLFQLDPERNTSYALGYEHQFNSELVSQFNFGGYYHDVQDRIGEKCLNADPIDGYCYEDMPVNIGQSEFYGTELSFSGNLMPSLRYSFDYTYTHARDTSADAETEYLRDIPTNEVTAMLIWDEPITGINSNLAINYKDEFAITPEDDIWEENVVVLDFGIRRDFLNHQLTVFANVNNLLDENFYEGDGQATEGRNFDIGVTYRF